MESNSWKNISLFVVLTANLLLLYLLYTNSTTSSLFIFRQAPPPNDVVVVDELDAVLERASMGANKTIIVAFVNKAYVEGQVLEPTMFDLFLEGFWHGEATRDLLDHLLIVALDQTAYDRCRFRGLHCYRLSTDGQDFAGEEVYMSRGFINMMWRRTLFLIQLLKKGYSFIFTDIDVIWLRNPFPYLATNYTDSDIQFSTDQFNNDSLSTSNQINTGFYFVKSKNTTISLFEKWYDLKDEDTSAKEQDVIQKMASQGVFGDLGLKAQFLETQYFSGFCQDTSDIRRVITVHANCCRFITAKVTDLSKVLHEWVQFRASPPNATTSLQWSEHVECPKSWLQNVGS